MKLKLRLIKGVDKPYYSSQVQEVDRSLEPVLVLNLSGLHCCKLGNE